MKIKTLKSYQEQAVESGLGVFLWAKSQYGALPPGAPAAERKKIMGHTGTVLLEAPTGSGKTLMAAHLLEEFSRRENVVWFWFAPFKGEQSEQHGKVLTEHPSSLLSRLRRGKPLSLCRASRLPPQSKIAPCLPLSWNRDSAMPPAQSVVDYPGLFCPARCPEKLPGKELPKAGEIASICRENE